MEIIYTLISVGFGATITYVFQAIDDVRKQKKEVRKDKINVFSNFLKEEVLNSPLSRSLHPTHFEVELFVNNIYPEMLDNYYFYPTKVRENFDYIYNEFMKLEFYDLPEDVSEVEFYESISKMYIEGVNLVKDEIQKIIN